MEQPAIFKLPNELLLIIFKNLSGCDVVAFSQSCKRFSALCQSVKYN